MELFDLANDPEERTNVALDHPKRLVELQMLMQKAHRPNPVFRQLDWEAFQSYGLNSTKFSFSSLRGKIRIPIPIHNCPGIQAVLKGMDDFKPYPLMGCHGLVIVQGNGGDRKINSNSCSFFILGSGLQLRTRYSILMDYFYFHWQHKKRDLYC